MILRYINFRYLSIYPRLDVTKRLIKMLSFSMNFVFTNNIDVICDINRRLEIKVKFSITQFPDCIVKQLLCYIVFICIYNNVIIAHKHASWRMT